MIKKVNNEKGSVLIVSLVVAALLATFSMGYLGLVVTEACNTGITHRSNVALHIAESGVEEAIWEIKHHLPTNFLPSDGWTGTNPVTKTASLTTSSGDNLGEYTVVVTDPAGISPVIESVGRALYQGSTLTESRTVEVSLLAGSVSMWQENQ